MQDLLLLRHILHDLAEVDHKEHDLVLELQLVVIVVCFQDSSLLLLAELVELHLLLQTVGQLHDLAQLPEFLTAELVQVPSIDKLLDHAEVTGGIDDTVFDVGAHQFEVPQIVDNIVDPDHGAAFTQLLENGPFLLLEGGQIIDRHTVDHLLLGLELQNTGKLQLAVALRFQALVNNALRTDRNEAVTVDTVGFIDDICVRIANNFSTHTEFPFCFFLPLYANYRNMPVEYMAAQAHLFTFSRTFYV